MINGWRGTEMTYEERQTALSVALREATCDYIALVPSTSLTYLTGIHGHLSERPFVVFLPSDPKEKPAAIIPNLEAVKGEQAGIPADRIISWRDEDGYAAAFDEAIELLNLADKTMGVEALKMRVLERDLLAQATIVHADRVVDEMRLRKSADEIFAMQIAIDVAEAAYYAFLPAIKIGMTEKQIAAKITLALMEAGADAMPFKPIVSAGANGASPHAMPTDRPIQSGDLLILDWGAQVGDYVSDITRTLGVGELDERAKSIHHVVRKANEAGRLACRPNVTGAEIDAAARTVIVQARYGDQFIHRTGHGLGMEAHEHPSIVAGNDDPLPIGAAFTIEPGIYITGFGGVRIEDDMVITADGAKSLTTLPRDLMFIH